MNKPVNSEIAKLLKEKGFNEKCKLLYKDGELINCKPYNVVDNKTFQSTRYYIAPIIAEVVSWLYKKHGIWIYSYKITPFVDDEFPYPKYVWISICDEKFVDIDNGLAINHHNSLTEAYEAAIEYALTKLI
jgi:hypothetical protein